MIIPSGSAGLTLYNTTDRTTNYERGGVSWASNILTFGGQVGGTGTLRAVRYQGTDGLRYFQIDTNGTPKFSTVSGSTSASSVSTYTGTLTASSGDQSFISIAPTITQSSTGGYTGIKVNPTESSTGSGTKALISLQLAGTKKFQVESNGDISVDKTVTAGGTTGAQTINKSAGSVNFAASDASLVVTNSLVTANSIIIATVATQDLSMKSVSAVAASGSFTLRGDNVPTGEVRVNFLVIN